MSRSKGNGFGYFPLDVDTDSDIKFQLLESGFGVIGFGIVIKLWQSVYRNEGYFTEWNDKIAIISAARWSSADFPVTESYVQRAVRKAAEYGLFDKELLNSYSILTSKGIQKQFFEGSKRRKQISVIEEYLLIPVPDWLENVNIKRLNANINHENVSRSTQREIEKENTIERERKRTGVSLPPPTKDEIIIYAKKENLTISPEKFFEYYSARNWKGVPDWKAKMREWNSTERKKDPDGSEYAAYDLDAYEKMLNES